MSDDKLVQYAKAPWCGSDGLKTGIVMATVDAEGLCGFLAGYCGVAAASGLPVTLMDVTDLRRMGARELRDAAEDPGTGLRGFSV